MSRRDCPEVREDCPYFEDVCYSDVHHLAWPAPEYRGVIANKYRELPENKIQTCRWEHDEIHEGPPPPKPTLEVMRQVILNSEVHLSRRVRRALNNQNGTTSHG